MTDRSKLPETISYECISHPDPFHPSYPIRDSDKQSSFYPEIDGFISYKAELRTHKNFALNLTIQAALKSSISIEISTWSNVEEELKLLKDLNRITKCAIEFIENNNLQKV